MKAVTRGWWFLWQDNAWHQQHVNHRPSSHEDWKISANIHFSRCSPSLSALWRKFVHTCENRCIYTLTSWGMCSLKVPNKQASNTKHTMYMCLKKGHQLVPLTFLWSTTTTFLLLKLLLLHQGFFLLGPLFVKPRGGFAWKPQGSLIPLLDAHLNFRRSS